MAKAKHEESKKYLDDGNEAAAVQAITAAPVAAAPAGRPAQPRYEIRTPFAGFTGKRPGARGSEIKFRDGVAETSDPVAAQHAISCGYQVTDRSAGQVSNPLKG